MEGGGWGPEMQYAFPWFWLLGLAYCAIVYPWCVYVHDMPSNQSTAIDSTVLSFWEYYTVYIHATLKEKKSSCVPLSNSNL